MDTWLEFGFALIHAMNNHDLYDFPSGQAVLAKVSHLRKRQEMSMRKVLVAAEFIRSYFPDVFLDGRREITMTDALKMRAIFTRNVDRIEQMTAEALETIRNDQSLKRMIADHEREVKGASDDYMNPAQRSSSFRAALRLHLEGNLPDYLGRGDFELFSGKAVTPHADLTIMRKGVPYIAIETKPAKRGVHTREIYELLGICALRLRPVEKNWVICDPTWSPHLAQIERCRSEVNLKGLSVGIFDQNFARPQVTWDGLDPSSVNAK